MTHSHVSRVSFICVTWLIHMCFSLIHMCHVTHSYVWRDSYICVTRVLACAPDPHTMYNCYYATWLIHMCDMTRVYVWRDTLWRDSSICVMDGSLDTIWMRHVIEDGISHRDIGVNPALQHAAKRWTRCNTLQHAATRCNTLQHTATYCNTLHQNATH